MARFRLLRAGTARLALPPGDLLRDAVYRRLWTSILISSLGAQVTLLALPLTAAVLLQASPSQMGWLTALEILPFALGSLPTGVWLDRVDKLRVYVVGETALAFTVAAVPVAWWLGELSMNWLYGVALVIGTVHMAAGSAAQVVLTQVVPRSRLVEAHARNALATSGAEVAGPGLAGALIRLLGAPVTLLADAVMLIASALILRGVRVNDVRQTAPGATFWGDLKAGVHFVATHRLLVVLALTAGGWQLCAHAAVVVQILLATRTLGLDAHQVGLAYMGLGVGSIIAGVLGNRISHRLGPGPCMVVGCGVCTTSWLLLAVAPANAWGFAVFSLGLLLYSGGAVLVFITFLALRQAVTPEPLLGRMTSVMRWLTMLPAGPGALIGGWLGEHVGLRAALAFASGSALLLTVGAWRSRIWQVRALPHPHEQGTPTPAA